MRGTDKQRRAAMGLGIATVVASVAVGWKTDPGWGVAAAALGSVASVAGIAAYGADRGDARRSDLDISGLADLLARQVGAQWAPKASCSNPDHG